jgi:hypothetical protein
MFTHRFEIVAKRIQAAKQANDPKSYTNAIGGLTRATRDLEKAVKKSNTGVQQRRAAAKRKKRMGESECATCHGTGYEMVRDPGDGQKYKEVCTDCDAAKNKGKSKGIGETRNPLKRLARIGHEASDDLFFSKGQFELWHDKKGSEYPAMDKDPDGRVYADKTSDPKKLVRYVKSAFKPGAKIWISNYGNKKDPVYLAGIEALIDAGFNVKADGESPKQGELPLDEPKQPTKGQQDMFDDSVMEGFGSMYGGAKTSYQPLGDVKLVVKHRKAVNEESRGARSRNIQSIYIQRGEERFKMQENNLKAARAMARHLQQGGEMHDSIGEAIVDMAVEQRKLKEFVRYVNSKGLVNETNSEYVQIARENMNDIKHNLDQLCGVKTYARAVESVTNYRSLEILEDDIDLESKFTETHFDERVAGATQALKHSIAKRNSYRSTIENAIQNENFESLKSALRETDGVVQYSSPQAQLSHQVIMMGDAAQDSTLRNHLHGISKRLDSGERLNDFDYKTVKGCLYNASQTHPATESVDTVGQLAEGYEKFLSGFDMY